MSNEITDPNTPPSEIPEPVEGKYIFQVASNIRIRFNADGWVEEIGRGGREDPLGTILQAKSGSKRDDVYARRFYDLYTRAVLLDIIPKNPADRTDTGGMVLFRDLEPGSVMFDRVNLIISIANHHFGTTFAKLEP